MSTRVSTTKRSKTAPVSRRNRASRRGTTTVEFAFVAPIIFILFFGVIELGRGLMVVHLLTNAARVGCRAGVIEGVSTNTISTAVKNSLTGVGMSGENVSVQVNDGATDASASKAGDEITVTASIPFSSVTWLPFGSFLSGKTLSGQYTLRRE
jgi:Flp pilus assembly protein TadG